MKRKISSLLFCLIVLIFAICNVGYSTVYADIANQSDYKYKSKILIEVNSGKVLDENNADEKLPIASIVKLMTLYIAFEALDNGSIMEEDLLQVSEYSASMGGSQLFLDANTEHKVCDLIKSIVIASANDSAVVLAENLAGSEENFVAKMNEKAVELSLASTHYVDCTGLNENGYSTARDVASLSRLVLTNPHYLKYSQIWLDSYVHPSGRETELANTNKLLRKYNYCVAGKTGTTEKAGYCYTSLCDNNGFKLIAVVLGADSTNDRFDIIKDTMQTGYANYKFTLKYCCGNFYQEIEIPKSKQKVVKLYLANDLGFVENKNSTLEFGETIKLNDYSLPIKAGAVVGELCLIDENGEVVARADLVVNESVEKAGYFDNIETIINKW